MKKIILKYKEVLIILMLSLPTLLWWLLPCHLVLTTDYDFPLDAIEAFKRTLWAWDSVDNTGFSGILYYSVRMTYYGFLAFLSFLGFSSIAIQKILFFFQMFLPGLGMYLFVLELNKERKNNYLAALTSSVFYMYNLYYFVQILDLQLSHTYTITPFLLWLFIKGVRKKQIVIYAIYISWLSVFYICSNMSSFIIGPLLFLFFVGFFIFSAFFNKDKSSVFNGLGLFLLATCFSILINLRWILPYVYTLSLRASDIQTQAIPWLKGISRYTSFWNVLRLIGHWPWFYKEEMGEVAFVKYYLNNPFGIILTFLPPILAYAPRLIFKIKDKYVSFFTVVSLIGIFLAMGVHFPTGWIYQWLCNYLPGFWIFRSPWYKFSFLVAFGYAFLIGQSIVFIYTRYLENKYKKIKITPSTYHTFVILLCILISFPFFAGAQNIKPSDRLNKPSWQVEIPDYPFKMAKWLNSQGGDERLALFPQVMYKGISTTYDWGYSNVQPFILFLLKDRSVLYQWYSDFLPATKLLELLTKSMDHTSPYYSDEGGHILGFLHVKYILQQNDFSYSSSGLPAFIKEKELFSKQKGIYPIGSFGKWDLYRNDCLVPKIYGTSLVYELEKSEELIDLIKIEREQLFAFFLKEDKIDLTLKKKIQILPVPEAKKRRSNLILPKVSYDKINPTEYVVHINTPTPFVLIFNETFDRDWEVSIEKKRVLEHFKINTYSNGYYLNKVGKYDIILKYKPQRLLKLGSLISSCTFLITIMVLIGAKVF